LDSLYAALPQPRLLSLMAQGGGNGTLKPMFTKSQTPYVFAKSGSMSGVYNLSGYLKAKSGRWLIFSCMSNHFNGPVYTARQDTELLIEAIRHRF